MESQEIERVVICIGITDKTWSCVVLKIYFEHIDYKKYKMKVVSVRNLRLSKLMQIYLRIFLQFTWT